VLRYLDLENRYHKLVHGAGLPAHGHSVGEIVRDVYTNGAHTEIKALDKVPVRKSVGTDMLFDLNNQRAIDFLQAYTFNLIQGMSLAARKAIQDVITRAFQQGGHPYDQAREIRSSIGLTSQQAQAVQNYRDALESGNPSQIRDSLSRELRDGRFDRSVLRAINEQTTIPQARIDAMVDRYAARQLNYRAEMIARTETARASNAGQQEAWDQAVDQGLLDPAGTLKVWIAAADCCDDCADVADSDGVPLDEMFDTSEGPLDGPPLHPNCRCSMGLEFPE
jgi:hypothetical protein